MGATLETLRRYVRSEINDPAPTRKLSTLTLTHDGGDNETSFFQDASHNFSTLGVVVGDVIFNTSDGGSLAIIRLISDGGGTNDKLSVDSIDGGTDNDYDNGDVVYIYDRRAQNGLDGTKKTDTEIDDAISQAQKVVAVRYGGIEKTNIHQDIIVQTLINCDNFSGTFQVGETATGGTGSFTATVEYVASDFLVISSPTGVFVDGEELTGGTSSATCDVNEPSGYTANNINIGQNLPTDLKNLVVARRWTGTNWEPLNREHIQELQRRDRTTGDSTSAAVWEDKIWLWPSTSTLQTNKLHLTYMAWDSSLSATTDETDFGNRYERVVVLEASLILSSTMDDNDRIVRITSEITRLDADIEGEDNNVERVRQEIDWDLLHFRDEEPFL